MLQMNGMGKTWLLFGLLGAYFGFLFGPPVDIDPKSGFYLVKTIQECLQESFATMASSAAKCVLFLVSSFYLHRDHGEVEIMIDCGDFGAQNINITLDDLGIPHIVAARAKDTFFAQGFLHARDRLWQMESTRRVVHGTLSEILGKDALGADKYAHTYGWSRNSVPEVAMLKQSYPQMYEYLQAYTMGVNCYLRHPEYYKPPAEFLLLGGHVAESWSVFDSLGILTFLSWQMSRGAWHEFTRSFWSSKFGNKSLELEIEESFRHISRHLPDGIEIHHLADFQSLSASPRAASFGGSNAWVISGKYTQSGKPFLANDPHLALSNPSIWYQIDMNALSAFHVAGASVPGCPAVFIGHNEFIGWGITLSFNDGMDFFLERVSLDRKTYEYRGEQVSLPSREIFINVKNQAPVNFTVYETHHGPIVSFVEGIGDALSLKAISFIHDSPYVGLLKVNMAQCWEDFLKATRLVQSVSLNIVYADVYGNIGYSNTGKMPVRDSKSPKGMMFSEGWTGQNEWIDWIPVEEMPHAFNPSQGFIVSANHRIVPDSFPHFLGSCYVLGIRGKRITDLISANILQGKKFTIQDMIDIQHDVISLVAVEIVKILKTLPAPKISDPNYLLGYSYLKSWNGTMAAHSIPATIYHFMIQHMLDSIFTPQLAKTVHPNSSVEKDLLLVRGGIPNSFLISQSETAGRDDAMVLKLMQN
eukprot:Sdes_comp15779_c0_seq1m4839